jgi:molecular chaperone DnaK
MGGVSTRLIEANTTIPKRASQVFSTAADSQPSVEIHVLQGERPMARDNRTIGKFMLNDIPPMRRGEPQIEVTFDIDANGVLSVSAKEMRTGKQQSIRIEASTGLSKDEVERMKREAQANADSDQKARELADKLNEADSLIFNTERQLGEYADKIPAEGKSNIEQALNALKEAHKSQDVTLIDKAVADLNNAWYAVTEQMGGADFNAGQQNEANNNKSNPDGNSSDYADFEEVKK